MNNRKISKIYAIDNTNTYVGCIRHSDIETKKNGILQIYLYDVATYSQVKGLIKTPSFYDTSMKDIDAMNEHIANNAYEFILTSPTKVILTRNAQELEEFNAVKKFTLTTFTKIMTFVPLSQRTIQSNLNKEHKRIEKQKRIDEIKSAINIDISDEGIKQIQEIIATGEGY